MVLETDIQSTKIGIKNNKINRINNKKIYKKTKINFIGRKLSNQVQFLEDKSQCDILRCASKY